MFQRMSQPEALRLEQDQARTHNWKRWGPYLSERQWGTVREDYSAWGDCWSYFPHDHARSRAYRWGEDGLLGIAELEFGLARIFGGRQVDLRTPEDLSPYFKQEVLDRADVRYPAPVSGD